MFKAGSKHAGLAATIAIALAATGPATSAAFAASAHNKKPQAKADSGPTIAVTITNKRKSGVAELDVAVAGSPAFKPLLKNLAPGKQAVVTLAHDENCAFDFYVKYDDGEISTVPNVHVCDDGKLNLVE